MLKGHVLMGPVSIHMLYFLKVTDPSISKAYAEFLRISHHENRYQKNNPEFDRTKKMYNGHSRQELSDIIAKFKKGESANIKNEIPESMDIKEYFRSQGPHFCAGYLANFNTNNINTSGKSRLWRNIKQIIHSKTYNAALEVLIEYKEEKLHTNNK